MSTFNSIFRRLVGVREGENNENKLGIKSPCCSLLVESCMNERKTESLKTMFLMDSRMSPLQESFEYANTRY